MHIHIEKYIFLNALFFTVSAKKRFFYRPLFFGKILLEKELVLVFLQIIARARLLFACFYDPKK